MKYRTILFDLDGTLTRSEEGITRSAIYAAEKLGFPGFTKEQVLPFIGPPLHHSFQQIMGMTSEQADEAVALYRERFSRIGWMENEVYEGIPALLRSLKKSGAKIAMATAKPKDFAERISEHFGFSPYLDALVGPDWSNKDSSKAGIVRRAMEALGGPVVMIGDRKFDVEGGRANGVDTIGVTYGYGSEEELREAGATYIVHSVGEMADLLLGDEPREKGLFITMEGVDGCGKTTQREALIAHMAQLGWTIKTTREPGGDAVAEKIRDLVLDPVNTTMHDETEAYLYAASRAQNVREMILPELKKGHMVVCDRFVDSSIAYQGGGRGLGTARVAQINEMAVGGLKPDITVYLRMDPAKALSRRLNASEPDRLEREKESFFMRTYEAYEALYAGEGMEHVITVDASQPIEDVTREMIEKLDARMKVLA